MEFFSISDSANFSRHPKEIKLYTDDKADAFNGDRVVSIGLLSKTYGLNQLFPFYFTLFARNPIKEKDGGLRKQIFNSCRITPVVEVKDGERNGYIEFALFEGDKVCKRHIINEIRVHFKDKSLLLANLEGDKSGVSRWYINNPELTRLIETPIDYLMMGVGDDSVALYKMETGVDIYKYLPKDVDMVFRNFLALAFEKLESETGWTPKSPSISGYNVIESDYAATTDYCYVYMMLDSSNGFYKIGMSNNPEYRESTLQGEKPTIEKVCERKYPSRRIAAAIESSLHKVFDAKRIRGEWFRLEPFDVWQIKETLK